MKGKWEAPGFGRTFRPSRMGFCPLRYSIPPPWLPREGCGQGQFTLGPAWDFHILRDLLGFAAKLEPPVLKTSVLLPSHCYSYKYEMPLTITFSPEWTGTTGFLSGDRQSATVPPSKGIISTLTVENMHLANCQRQYSFASLISSTYIQGGSETNF